MSMPFPSTSASALLDNPTTSSNPMFTNRKWILKQRPNGLFDPKTDVELITEDLNSSSCADDEVVVQVSTLSVDAFIRTMLDEEAYHGSVPLGQTLPALGLGQVVQAGRKSGKRVGQHVVGMMGAQSLVSLPAQRVFPVLATGLFPQTASLGLTGLTTGFTAYAGVFYVCGPPKRGQTVVVTAAAGAVGSVASQLARTTGARVIGVAGGSHKCQYLRDELQLDGAVDYKEESNLSLQEQLDELCPDGIDFVFDNVGGSILDELLGRIRPGARVVICGAVSQYSGNVNHRKVQGPSNYLKLAERGATMRGFNVMQYIWRLPLMLLGMMWFYWRGQVRLTEHFEIGIESFPVALQKLFTGGHVGKMLVQVDTQNKKKDN